MDYGKIAYLKTQDLSRRIGVMSKAVKQKTLHFGRKYGTVTNNVPFEFSFVSESAQTAEISFDFTLKAGSNNEVAVYCYVNGVIVSNFTHYVSSYATSTEHCAVNADILKGENVIAINFVHNLYVNGTVYAEVRGENLALYSAPPRLFCLVDNDYYMKKINGKFEFYYPSLAATPLCFDTTTRKIDKMVFFIYSVMRTIFIAGDKVFGATFQNRTLGTPVLLASGVSDFVYCAPRYTLFTVVNGSLYKQTINPTTFEASEAVAVNLANSPKISSVYLALSGSNGYLFAVGGAGTTLYSYTNNEFEYLGKCGVCAVDAKVGSDLRMLGISGGLASDYKVTWSDGQLTLTATPVHAACDAICYANNYLILHNGQLSII